MDIQKYGNRVVPVRHLGEESRKALPKCGHGNKWMLEPWKTVDRISVLGVDLGQVLHHSDFSGIKLFYSRD